MPMTIYTGLLVAVSGTVLAIGEWRGIIALSLLFAAHWRKARNEEAILARNSAMNSSGTGNAPDSCFHASTEVAREA